MEYRDYIIALDENGQPYIEHGVFDRIKNSKYYQKIKTGYGWRYFYDPEEWQAYVNGRGNAPKSLVGRVKDKLGFDEKARRSAAESAYSKANIFNSGARKASLDKANNEYGNTVLGRIEKSLSVIKESSESVLDGAKKLLGNAKAISTKIGAPIKDVYDFVDAAIENNKNYKEWQKYNTQITNMLEEARKENPTLSYITLGLNVTLTKEFNEAFKARREASERMNAAYARAEATKTFEYLHVLDQKLYEKYIKLKNAWDALNG